MFGFKISNLTKKYSQTSDDKKKLLSNFISLSSLNLVNMILPLITLPYLVNVIGVEKFGLLNFSLSIIMYLNLLVSFGFDLSATREISINRGNTNRISEIFWSVMFIQLTLLLISFLILLTLILTIDSINQNMVLYFTTYGLVVGNLLFPTWFFQGMEKMKYITFINVISKIIFTGLIFVFVKTKEDYLYVPILNSLGVLFGGILAFILVFKVFTIKLIFPTKRILLSQFKDSFYFFFSRIANDGSRYYATTIIGIYFGNTIVGYFSMIEKLFYTFLSFGGIVSQAIYPYMSRTRNIVFFKKIFFIIISLSILLLIPIMYFNEMILKLVFNITNNLCSDIFLIIFSGSIFGTISALIGYPLLAAFGYIKYANYSLIFASIIYVFCISFSVIILNNIYFAVSSLVIFHLFGLIYRVRYIYKTKLLIQVIVP